MYWISTDGKPAATRRKRAVSGWTEFWWVKSMLNLLIAWIDRGIDGLEHEGGTAGESRMA